MPRICLILVLAALCPSLWADALAGESHSASLPQTVTASLASSKIKDRGVAIEYFRNDVSESSTRFLAALLVGELYYDKESGDVFLVQDGIATDTKGVAVPFDAARLKKIAINNKQRQEIAAVLNSRALHDVDPAKRRAASATLMEAVGPEINRDELTALLDVEKDPVVRKNLRTALGILIVNDPAADPALLRESVDWLAAGGQPAARNALEILAQSAHGGVADAAADALYWNRVARDWAVIAETAFFGLSLGSILVLAAIGLAITFGVMGVINMAHGELIMIGAYVAWGMQQLLPGHSAFALVLAVPASFLVSGAIGVVLEKGVIRFLYGRPLETLLATFGISLILQQTVRSIFSPLNRAVENPPFMSGMWRIGDNFSITCSRFYIVLFCALVFFLIYAVMRWTRLGLEVRAVSQNRAIARALGVRDARVDALTFGLGAGVAGLAGVALSQITNVGPNLGQAYIVDSFMVVVFGGVGNLWGTMIGGLVLGLANKTLEPFSGAMLSKIVILVFIILFIQKRPRGLFPQKGRAVES